MSKKFDHPQIRRYAFLDVRRAETLHEAGMTRCEEPADLIHAKMLGCQKNEAETSLVLQLRTDLVSGEARRRREARPYQRAGVFQELPGDEVACAVDVVIRKAAHGIRDLVQWR